MLNDKTTKFLLSCLLLMLIIWLGILARNDIKEYRYIGQSAEQKHSITITGEGKVTAVPDIAKIQIGYHAEKSTVAAAQAENTEKMNAIISKLKKDFNIDAKDIKTANYNIYPSYDWNEGRQILRGYQVSQNLDVKIRELDKISEILAAAGQAGLNQLGGLTFDVDEPEKLRQEARELAIKNAKEKAESLAKVAGVNLGSVISFSEISDQPVYSARMYAMEDMAMGKGGAAPDVEAGSTEITITAAVEYEIY